MMTETATAMIVKEEEEEEEDCDDECLQASVFLPESLRPLPVQTKAEGIGRCILWK